MKSAPAPVGVKKRGLVQFSLWGSEVPALSCIYIGFDPRPVEVQAYAVARNSIKRRLNLPIPICPLIMGELYASNMYTRPISFRGGKMFDLISNAPMSTEFALTRFLVPHLVQEGYVLFVDADVMARCNVALIMDEVDPDKAVSVVKHKYTPSQTQKMDGQIQTSYERKNWSSVVVWNASHHANKLLTPELVSSARGLWLHQFSWLEDREIGELDPKWNYLVGQSPKQDNPSIVHFTDGTPAMKGYENCEYADEWSMELERWAN